MHIDVNNFKLGAWWKTINMDEINDNQKLSNFLKIIELHEIVYGFEWKPSEKKTIINTNLNYENDRINYFLFTV